MEQLSLLLLIVAACIGLVYNFRMRSLSCASLPHVRSLIPWVGSGLFFGWNSRDFYRRCLARYGNNYRATVAGLPFVFLSSPAALETFYRNRTHGLMALRPVGPDGLGGKNTDKTVSIITHDLIPIIAKANRQPDLDELMQKFNEKLFHYLDTVHTSQVVHGGPIALKRLIAFGLYSSLTTAMFGDNFPVHSFEDFGNLDDTSYYLFCRFYFFPWRIHRAQERYRQTLIDFMKPWKETNGDRDIEGVSAHGNEILRSLARADTTDAERGGLLLTYIWGTYTNTTRVILWLFAHLLHDDVAYARVKAEIDAGVKEAFPDHASLLAAPLSVLTGPQFRLLDSAIREVFRLHNLPTSYRATSADVDFPSDDGGSFSVKPGNIVVANVAGVHWNEDFFPDPRTFRVDRFMDPNQIRFLYMFGKGSNMCTGRYVAKYTIKMFAILCIRFFELEPQEGRKDFKLPAENPRCVGVMLPAREIPVFLQKRKPLAGS